MLVLRHNRSSTMKKKKQSPEQIITKLRKVEALTAEGATIAEAAMLRPSPMANTRMISEAVRPTAATASAPSLPTK